MEINKKDLDSILEEDRLSKLEEAYTVKYRDLEVRFTRTYHDKDADNYILLSGYSEYEARNVKQDLAEYIINEWVGNKLIVSFRKKYEELIKEKYIDKIINSIARYTERKKWILLSDDNFINIEDFSVEFCFLDDEYFSIPEPKPPSRLKEYWEKMHQSSLMKALGLSKYWNLGGWDEYYAAFSIYFFFGFPFSWFFIGFSWENVYIWCSNIPLFGFWFILHHVFNYRGFFSFWLVAILYYLLAFGVI